MPAASSSGVPGRRMALEHFRDFPEGGDGLVEVALVQLGADCRRHSTAQRSRKHAAAVRTERARLRHPFQPRLHGPAGQAKALGEHHDGEPGIIVERREDPPVGGVQLLQSDHSLPVRRITIDQSDQSRMRPLR